MGKSVKLMPGRRVAIVNSSFKTFNGPVRNIRGDLYVPGDFISKVYGARINTSGNAAPAELLMKQLQVLIL